MRTVIGKCTKCSVMNHLRRVPVFPITDKDSPALCFTCWLAFKKMLSEWLGIHYAADPRTEE